MNYRAIVVAGFLGSGKTTFILESLLPLFQGEQVSILVNDFGEISFDKLKYYERKLQVLGIEGSCICCSAGEAFLQALAKVKKLSKRVIIETSGVSEIDPIYEALEIEGFTVETSFTTLNLDLPSEIFFSNFVQGLILSSHFLILTKADLLTNAELRERLSTISSYKKPYLIAYEGKVKENLREFLSSKPYKTKGSPRHSANTLFKSATLKPKGFYCRIDLENYLKSLPKEIFRVKGIISCIESPVPLAVNFSCGYITWEKMEVSTGNFLTFIGSIDPRPFFLYFPHPIEISQDIEDKMFPLGNFAKREGVAYFKGKVLPEIEGLYKFFNNLNSEKNFLLILGQGLSLSPEIRKQIFVLKKYEYSYLLKVKEKIKNTSVQNIIFIGVPAGIVSWFIKNLNQKKIIYLGKTYLLPDAYLSLKVDSMEKREALYNLISRALSMKKAFIKKA